LYESFSSALVQHSPLDRPVSRPHLDVALRELISQLQARAQRIDEAPMPRFRPPVDLHEKVLVLLQTARTAFSWHPPLVCSTGVSQFGGKRFKRLKRNVFQCGSRRSESGSLATFGIRRLELASQLFKTALDVTSCASKTGGWRFILLEQTSLRRGEVAMIAVIFEVMQAAGRKTDYLEHAAHLKGELERMDEFISVERFQSLTDPDKLLSLSFCRDDDAVARWRCHAGHRAAQAAGREGVFRDYRLLVAFCRSRLWHIRAPRAGSPRQSCPPRHVVLRLGTILAAACPRQ
jgi:heme-degrading monooxygenase HmoA